MYLLFKLLIYNLFWCIAKRKHLHFPLNSFTHPLLIKWNILSQLIWKSSFIICYIWGIRICFRVLFPLALSMSSCASKRCFSYHNSEFSLNHFLYMSFSLLFFLSWDQKDLIRTIKGGKFICGLMVSEFSVHRQPSPFIGEWGEADHQGGGKVSKWPWRSRQRALLNKDKV